MRLNSEWRKFATKYRIGDGTTLHLHSSIPSQAEYVGEWLVLRGVNVAAMNWREHLFYLLHGFLVDAEYGETSLGVYLTDVDGKTLEEAWDIHMSHPILSATVYAQVKEAFNATRDTSLETRELNVDSDEDEEDVEKKELA